MEIEVSATQGRRSLLRYSSEQPVPNYSGLMLAALITLPHFSTSSATCFSKSTGELRGHQFAPLRGQ